MKKKVLEELFYDESTFEKWLNETYSSNTNEYVIPYSRFDVNITKDIYSDLVFYSLMSKKQEASSIIDDSLIIYLHGGAYVSQPSLAHWRFLNSIARDTGLNILLPLYPKIPFFDASYSIKTVIDFYRNITSAPNCPDKIILMGDSSGGGFLLSMTMELEKQNLTLPSQLIMFSPWLDVSMTNNRIPEIEPFDSFLSPFVLKKLGNLWCNGLDNKDPLVSPLYGDLKFNGKITIFSGTHDILNPDSKAFYDRNKNNASINYVERQGLMHAYNILTAKGFKLEYDNIINLITNDEGLL